MARASPSVMDGTRALDWLTWGMWPTTYSEVGETMFLAGVRDGVGQGCATVRNSTRKKANFINCPSKNGSEKLTKHVNETKIKM